MSYTRRDFIRTSAIAAGGTAIGFRGEPVKTASSAGKEIRIVSAESNFEREPLIRPFGFKGGYMNEIWQSAVNLGSEAGIRKTGLCSQSILWSDAQVFASHSESGGNALMFAMTEYSLGLLRGRTFTNPVALIDELWPQVLDYGKKICSKPDLRQTFALNSLVPVDNALWLLYAAENNISNFDDLVPAEYRPALSHHHKKLASIPLISYSVPVTEIKNVAGQGYFFMKIKIGQPGTQEEMLEKDKQRISDIHNALKDVRTAYTADSRLPYYFDANGRYEKKDTLLRLLDHCRKIGAFDQIAIIEEPFPEQPEADVSDIPVRIAADESAHTDKDALARIQMGYRAIALKAIAKTLSMTMKIALTAHENNVPCYCADLTVSPLLVEWNKNVAARLAPFPGLGTGLLETNGHQNYRNWDTMRSYHPCSEASWTKTTGGVFELDKDYYDRSGCIFTGSKHYDDLFKH